MVQMHGIEYKAIAKDDLELPDNSHEHWIKGNSYTLIYDKLGGIYSLTSESGFRTHYTQKGFDGFKDLFDITPVN
jgi:hypothetical protein